MVAVVLTATIVGCSKDNDNSQQYNPLIDNPKEPAEKPVGPESPSGYDEKYRPQIHYTPAKNWVNDPNGLVYADGVYHLFYQYNPKGNDWGNMSWGHATSKDLMHWEEQPVARLDSVPTRWLQHIHLLTVNSSSLLLTRQMVEKRSLGLRITLLFLIMTITCATRRCSGTRVHSSGSWPWPRVGRKVLTSMVLRISPTGLS